MRILVEYLQVNYSMVLFVWKGCLCLFQLYQHIFPHCVICHLGCKFGPESHAFVLNSLLKM